MESYSLSSLAGLGSTSVPPTDKSVGYFLSPSGLKILVKKRPLFNSGAENAGEEDARRALPEFQYLLDLADWAGGGIALAILQYDQILAVERWLKLLDLVDIDDYRAADAQKSLVGEMGFQRTHGFAQDVIFLGDMYYGVFAGGLDGLNLVQFDEGNLARGFDRQSSELTCGCRCLAEEGEKSTGGNAGPFIRNEVPRALDRLLEPNGLEWF